MDVSIIIPAYNRLWCLPKAIESCRDTRCKTEIIVVDDGSTDGTWEWLKQQHDIIALKQDHLGKCWAVNKGYQLALGKYIRFLDSDDILADNAVDEQFKIAETHTSDVVVSGYTVIDEEDKIVKEQRWITCDDFIAQQLGECDGSHYSAFLFNKKILADIPHRPDYAFRDDRLFILEVAIKHPIISIHPGKALIHKTHHKRRLQNTSGLQQSVQNYQHLNLYKLILNKLINQHGLNTRRISAATSILWPLAHWIAKNNLSDAEQVVKWIYKLDPEFKIPETGVLGIAYKRLGFNFTERLLRMRRMLLLR